MISNFIQSHIHQPKFQLGVILTLIFFSATIYRQSIEPIISLCIALIATVGSDLLFVTIRKKPLFFPSAALVTAFIIALLADPKLPWYDIALCGITAMASKNFIRFSGRHVFNPAAFALLITALIFNHNISWWGVSFQQFFPRSGISLRETISPFIYFLILLSPALISAFRMRRFRITIAFFIIYAILHMFVGSQGQLDIYSLLTTTILDPTTLFFALVMLPEPMTTPNNHARQLLFGVSVAILTILLSSSTFNSQLPIFNFSDPLVFSLLIGNLLFFRFR